MRKMVRWTPTEEQMRKFELQQEIRAHNARVEAARGAKKAAKAAKKAAAAHAHLDREL